MPKNPGQTNKEASADVRQRLLLALVRHPDGLTFTQWWKAAHVHKDTLATWKPKLLVKLVEQSGRIYRLRRGEGEYELGKMQLIESIRKSRSFVWTEGELSGHPDPAKSVKLKSTRSFAFPPLPPRFLDAKDGVHTALVGDWLLWEAQRHEIDPRYLTGELPLRSLMKILKRKLPRLTQGLAFLIDFQKIRKIMNEPYVADIVASVRRSKGDSLEALALEAKVLERLRESGTWVTPADLAADLGLSEAKTTELLDSLCIGSVTEPRNSKGFRIRLQKSKQFLHKSEIFGKVHYKYEPQVPD